MKFLAALSIGLGLLISFVIARNLSGTTRQLTAITDSLANGNMTERSTLDQKNEMGRLACSTNNTWT